jgi:thiosulfate reductase/polysulfide reductase chain A
LKGREDPHERKETLGGIGGLDVSRRGFLSLAAGSLALQAASQGWKLLPKEASADPGNGSTSEDVKVVPTVCGVCTNKCGAFARVVDGKVVKLDGNPDHPKSKGRLCARGQAMIQVTYDPNRLKYPLIRSGPRGSGQWRRASWEEALDYTAEKLLSLKEKYGPQGVMFSSTEGFQEHFFMDLAEAFGSPNTFRHPTQCLVANNVAFFHTYGTVPVPDVANSCLIIMAGANRAEAIMTPDTIDLFRNLHHRNKFIYIDPRYTVTASKADIWVPVKPGTDLALVLAMIHVMITEESYDKPFVEAYTHGFDKLEEHIQPYTPEWAAKECEVPAAQIVEIARMFATAAPKCLFYFGRRSSFDRNQTQFRRAIAIINALAGNWDHVGGMLPPASARLGFTLIPPFPDVEAPRVDGLPESFPLNNTRDGVYHAGRENVLQGKPYPVKGWMVYKQNPIHGMPDRAKTQRMIDQMEFLCVIDILPTDMAWQADVILPEATYLEREDPLHTEKALVPHVSYRQQAIQPLFETKPNFWIMKELAARLGLGEYFDYDVKEYINNQMKRFPAEAKKALQESGVWVKPGYPRYGKHRARGRFLTPTKKIELYSTRFEKYGKDPLPVYRSLPEPPQGKYRLLMGRNAYFTHAALQNNLWLLALYPENRLWIHPEEATQIGIHHGDSVEVTSPVGKGTLKAHVTEAIRRDSVYMDHGFGHTSQALEAAYGRGVSDQVLIEDIADEISGGVCYHETFVEVRPVT